MAGAALTAGVVAGCAALLTGLVVAGAAGAESQRAAGVADAAALAAADAVSGAVPGDPCGLAAEVAAAQAATVTECTLDGLVATVAIQTRFASFPVHARARAGPPPDADVGEAAVG